MYGAIITVVFIESSEQARIRRQQYLQQYKMPNEIHENVVIENSIISRETTDDESDINTLYLDSFKSKNNCKSFETNSNLLDKNGKPVEIMVCDVQELHFSFQRIKQLIPLLCYLSRRHQLT